MSKTVFDNIDPVVLARVRAMRLLDDEFMSAAFSEKTNLFGKSVKLDVVAEDIFKTEYNIEIQRADSGASARRIRH